MELVADDVHLSGLIERFEAGLGGAGVEPSLIEAITLAAPPARVLVGRLVALLPALDEPGRFAVAALAVALAADPGYRPLVERIVSDHPLDASSRSGLAMRGSRLDGEALRWWLDVVAEKLPASPTTYALYRRREIVLAQDRDVVARHLVRTDGGPGGHAAELAVEVLRRGGPCPPVEAMFSRWIREGRFDGDASDSRVDSTSAQVLVSCLERAITDGPFTARWSLAREAVEHWRELLSSGTPEVRGRGAACIATLLTCQVSLAGVLPWGLASLEVRRRPEWPVIERGFSAVNTVRRTPRRAAELDPVIRESALELATLATSAAPEPADRPTRRWRPLRALAHRDRRG